MASSESDLGVGRENGKEQQQERERENSKTLIPEDSGVRFI